MCVWERQSDRSLEEDAVSLGAAVTDVCAAWCVFCGVSILIHWALSLAPFAPFLRHVFYFICAFGFYPCSSSEFAARMWPILSSLPVTRKPDLALGGSVACSPLIVIRKTISVHWSLGTLVVTDSIFRGSSLHSAPFRVQSPHCYTMEPTPFCSFLNSKVLPRVTWRGWSR